MRSKSGRGGQEGEGWDFFITDPPAPPRGQTEAHEDNSCFGPAQAQVLYFNMKKENSAALMNDGL